ncbi:actin patch protein 1, partial [Patellaria atrata CBS 101060]
SSSSTSSLLRYLFPHTRQRARTHLSNFRHETLPDLKRKAHAHIYKYYLYRKGLRQLKKPGYILQNIQKHTKGLLSGRRWNKDASGHIPKMTSTQGSSNLSGKGSGNNSASEGREPGARRKKLAGYLKAANELRLSYTDSYKQGWNNRGGGVEDFEDNTPGSFPDAAVVRSGREEMILFPSYARTHVKRKPETEPGTIQETEGAGRDVRDSTGTGDAEFWRQEWERFEDDNAVVDVDVRGWVYSPHKGQMNRKQRLFIGLARQLVGIPAPSGTSPTASATNSRGVSPHKSHLERVEERASKHDEEFVSREAESIMRKGEAEATIAGLGEYSENPSKDDADSIKSGRGSPFRSSRDSEVTRTRAGNSSEDNEPPITSIQKRASWNQPSNMSQAELAEANKHLMSRLMPFLANPMANTAISAFFFNENKSRQKTINTDAAGHFNFRAALDFVPTHVRILASEKLSVTEEISITESQGISLISDIDDTIKHSAITAGAREIFRNAFIRDLGDLTIEGVKEWYNQLAARGVKFHYVSNSPWQVYPIISKFFSMAGLPSGSFHLKQYSGMFQGIFEPVAERKKGTLDRLARDFPERKYILVGDSGEADLEVYTDFVLENPGRVLGVFIRDVTTPVGKGFFDPSIDNFTDQKPSGSGTQGSGPNTRNSDGRPLSRYQIDEEDDKNLKSAIAASLQDIGEQRPPLPPRRPTEPPAPEPHSIENLIDFSDDEGSSALSSPHLTRSTSADSAQQPDVASKPSPPIPPKPRRTYTTGDNDPNGQQSYASSARQKLASAYNNLPSASSYWSGKEGTQSSGQSRSMATTSIQQGSQNQAKIIPPPPPRQRNLTSYPAAAAQYAYSTVRPGGNNLTNNGDNSQFPNKREDMWRRRWARAEQILKERGVELYTWRVGSDAMKHSIALLEKVERNSKNLKESQDKQILSDR